ncbi:PTIP binding protein Pa1 [Haematobia irritans]|uniref:PTIP binding protein Pa1 n=1 Tax=Haematobia irritans TaxID=7368 RepID=UPI003F4F7DED
MSSEVSSSVDSTFKDNDDIFPTAEELESYYNMLENGTILELEWHCPGRRPPSPDASNTSSKEQTTSAETTEPQEPMKANDFDFSDDVTQLNNKLRRQGTPKSVKKKTANFAGVMEALKKKNAEGSN